MADERLLWLAGKLVPAKDAKLNILSPTSQYGINVFEVIRCYEDSSKSRLSAFRFDDHIERLFNSAKALKLRSKYSADEIKNAFVETISANNYKKDASARIVLFINEDGSWASEYDCELLIAAIPRGRVYEPDVGITCCVSSWERIHDKSISPRIKAGANYLNSRMAQLEAVAGGYDTALFLNRKGKVSESPASCIFLVKKGELITPPLTASILESITRDTIIKIAKDELGMTVVERDIERVELYDSDEIFLCGTTVEIVPVFSVDKTTIGNGKMGELTKTIRGKYFSVVRGEIDKYKKWLLPISKDRD